MISRLLISLIFLALLMAPAYPASGGEDYQVISGELILDVARSYILTHSPWSDYDVTVGFKREMADVPAYLRGKVDLEVEQSREAGLADVNVLKVRIDINGEPYVKIDVGPYLSVNLPIVVAAGDIKRGLVISDSDVSIETRDLTAKRLNEPITDIAETIGMAAKQSIKKGEAVLSRHLDLPVLVERGKDVTVVVVAAGLTVTITVQALDNGKMGEMVRVKNKSSGVIITGEVIGRRLVEVKI